MNQLVGYNIAYFRKAAGMTQEELGERLGGWSAPSVSAAERSWDGKRVRKFDADELVMIATVLGVPVPGLFLPPDGESAAVHYVLDAGIPGGKTVDLLSLVLPAGEGDSPVMDAYRERLIMAGARAERLEGDVRDGAVAPLVRERDRLERRIEDLRAFERDYKTRLHTYLVGQLRQLWSGDMRPEVEQMIEEIGRNAAGGGGHVRAVLLRPDGTYDFLEPGPAGDQ